MASVVPLPSAEPLTSAAAHQEQLKQLRRQLLLKQFELDTVLGVAHDMTAATTPRTSCTGCCASRCKASAT